MIGRVKDRQIERQTDTRRRIPVRDIILPVEGCSVCVTEGFSRVGTRRLKKKKKEEEEEEEGEEEEEEEGKRSSERIRGRKIGKVKYLVNTHWYVAGTTELNQTIKHS